MLYYLAALQKTATSLMSSNENEMKPSWWRPKKHRKHIKRTHGVDYSKLSSNPAKLITLNFY